jgi:hypothetical protein
VNVCIPHASHYPATLIRHLQQVVSKSLQENPARALEAISVNYYRFVNDVSDMNDAREIFSEA